MGIFSRFKKRSKSEGGKALPLADDESASVFRFFSGMSTTELLSNTTVSACVSLIADAVAVLSCHVYEKTDSGRVRARTMPLYGVLNGAPNEFDTPYTFWQKIMYHLLLRGNAFIFIEQDGSFGVKSLTPLDPDRVEIRRDADGEIYYVYNGDKATLKYQADRILHVPAKRYSGLRGLSPIEYAHRAARLGLNLDKYTDKFFTEGVHSKFVLTVPSEYKNWNEENTRELQKRFMESYSGPENSTKPLVLNKGITGTPLDISGNSDAQLVENRAFSEREIAKIFRVPLFMLGKDDAKFTNMEQINTFFLQQTLTPWLVLLQQYFDRLIPQHLRATHYVEFDANSLLRADYRTRMDGYTKGLNNGLYTLNEIREMENMEKVDEAFGNKHFMQVNMSTMDKIAAGGDEKDNGADAQGE